MVKLSDTVIAAAIAAEKEWGVPAPITLAQYGLESAWGEKDMGALNFFGMKAPCGKDGQIKVPHIFVKTREVDKYGRSYYEMAPFRKFLSIAECFDCHGRLLGTAQVYKNARAVLPDVNRYADALTGVYATAPNYGTELKRIMRTSDLYKYGGQGK